jgi:hypothetical protein
MRVRNKFIVQASRVYCYSISDALQLQGESYYQLSFKTSHVCIVYIIYWYYLYAVKLSEVNYVLTNMFMCTFSLIDDPLKFSVNFHRLVSNV